MLLTDPSSATAAAAAARTVGCGIDATSAAAFGQNPTFQALNRRAFYPPCGKAHDQTLVGAAYRGDPTIAAGKDYAYQASACPYYTSANNQTYDSTKGGYDPEFYNPSPNNSQIPDVFFVKGLVYHDNVHDAGADGETNRNWARTALGLGHNFGNGWSARASPAQAYPYKTSGGYATLQEFCDEQGTTALANGQVPSTVCMECLDEEGLVLRRHHPRATQDGVTNAPYPSLWYTGNYLNFFPPKFVVGAEDREGRHRDADEGPDGARAASGPTATRSCRTSTRPATTRQRSNFDAEPGDVRRAT